MTRGRGGGTFVHPWWVASAALLTGVVAWWLAVQDPISGWELDLVRWLNGAPGAFAVVLYPVMQVGTLAGPIVVALWGLVVRRDGVFAVAVVVGGLAAWFGAKVVKDLVDRGRPVAFLPDIDVREPSAHGAGFISGHSAVAMFTMVVLMALVPPRWRPLLLGVALLVGVARMVYGVHLPADVLGGWAFGALIGLATVAAVDRIGPGRVAHQAEGAAS